jgi:hypothetical protein
MLIEGEKKGGSLKRRLNMREEW